MFEKQSLQFQKSSIRSLPPALCFVDFTHYYLSVKTIFCRSKHRFKYVYHESAGTHTTLLCSITQHYFVGFVKCEDFICLSCVHLIPVFFNQCCFKFMVFNYYKISVLIFATFCILRFYDTVTDQLAIFQ